MTPQSKLDESALVSIELSAREWDILRGLVHGVMIASQYRGVTPVHVNTLKHILAKIDAEGR